MCSKMVGLPMVALREWMGGEVTFIVHYLLVMLYLILILPLCDIYKLCLVK